MRGKRFGRRNRPRRRRFSASRPLVALMGEIAQPGKDTAVTWLATVAAADSTAGCT